MSLKVYISSTHTDLIDERAKLRLALKRAGYDPWCMEEYPAFSERPKNKCEDDVRACDIYICIMGTKYGSKPNGYDLSFTEYEYLAAYTCQPQKEILVFIKEVEPIDPELDEFRKRIQKKHGSLLFKTEADLAVDALASIVHSQQKKIAQSTRRINRNLIYLCDREPQYSDLSEKRIAVKGRPVLFSLEGLTKNKHRSFLKRLNFKEDKLFLEIEVNLKVEGCNSANAVSKRILTSIFTDLENKGIPVGGKLAYPTLKNFFSSQPYKTILIVIYVQESSINDKQKLQKYKDGIAAFADDIKELTLEEKSLLICICLEERAENSDVRLPQIVSSNRSITRLPRLPDIVTGDVEDWLQRHQIETDWHEIENIVKSIYKSGANALPLSEIEQELEKIIQAYNSKNDGKN